MKLDVFDQRTVKALHDFGHEPGEFLAEMLHDFLIEAPSLVAEIEGAVEGEAYAAAAGAAHRLRGVSGHMGAARLAAIATEVEIAARTGSRRSTVGSIAAIRAELELAITAAHGLLTA